MAGKTNNIDAIIFIKELDTLLHVHVGLRLLFVALFLSYRSSHAYGRMNINTIYPTTADWMCSFITLITEFR